MDVYLLPTRAGHYFLYAGELGTAFEDREPGTGSDSTGKRLVALLRKGFHRVTWSRRQKELLLQSLGALERVRVLYPSSLSAANARGIFDDLVESEIAKHKKWMVVNTAAIPVAVPLSLVPGPNLLLAYLAWRSLTHYKTKKAGERAAGLPVDFVAEPRLNELVDLVRRWPMRARLRIRELGESLGFDRLDRAYV
ncbi:MAG TPA: hypothetical protein VEK15_24365 [Vicinamibacteria bacterium]|nr:hypothetical protein [Vicinamibacteria bacterium]